MKVSRLEEIGSLAIVGATGMVGREFLNILEERKIQVGKIKLLASESSAGETIDFGSYMKAEIAKLAQIIRQTGASVN